MAVHAREDKFVSPLVPDRETAGDTLMAAAAGAGMARSCSKRLLRVPTYTGPSNADCKSKV